MRSTLIFIAKWTTAGLAFALVLAWIRPDLRSPPAPRESTPQPTIATPKPASIAPAVAVSPSQPSTYADAVAKSAPAVVGIYTALAKQPLDSSESNRVGDWQPPDPIGPNGAVSNQRLGSGVVVDAQGHVVTNHHVVADAHAIKLQLADGRIADASVVGNDPETDLAVLKIKLDKLMIMPMGRSDKLRVGDVVLAIGNPYGLSQTVTLGIVSATGRDQLHLSKFENYIQTDAAINLGNSGGALINTDGELIGINTVILGQKAGVEGISFAIPVNLVRGVVEQIIKHGHVRRGWLGVNSQDVSPEHAAELGIAGKSGVELLEVYADSPAARAGLQKGDVLIALNGVAIRDAREAMNRVAGLAPGKTLRVKARRDQTTIDVSVKVEERRETD